ncbi:YdcH family protein [Pelagibacterium sp.]|uniref:YdcH family protein n=1 Tax=Pelagibacterium sp. TaxID=1967288 RepID=UPI003A9317EE
MTSQTYITSLERRHQDLERKISEELRHPARDALLIAALKRKKLELKDQMARAQHETTH